MNDNQGVNRSHGPTSLAVPMRRIVRTTSVVAIVGGMGLMGAQAASATKPNPQHLVPICHRTDSYSNPYVLETVDVASVDGNAGNDKGKGDHRLEHTGPVFYPTIPKHTKWGDIISPYYVDGSPTGYGGYNWTPEGIAIFQNGCKVPSSPTTTTTTTPPVTTTTTATQPPTTTTTTTAPPTTTTTTTTTPPVTTTTTPVVKPPQGDVYVSADCYQDKGINVAKIGGLYTSKAEADLDVTMSTVYGSDSHTVTAGNSADFLVNTGLDHVPAGVATFTEKWTDKSPGVNTFTVHYGAVDCRDTETTPPTTTTPPVTTTTTATQPPTTTTGTPSTTSSTGKPSPSSSTGHRPSSSTTTGAPAPQPTNSVPPARPHTAQPDLPVPAAQSVDNSGSSIPMGTWGFLLTAAGLMGWFASKKNKVSELAQAQSSQS